MRPALRSSSPALVAVAWPLFAELLLATLVGMAGLTLAARVSEAAAGAYALSNHVQAALFLLYRIIGMGAGVVITQQLGAGDRRGADETARAAIGASTWLGAGAGLAVLLGAGAFLQLLNAPADVLAIATPYLRTLALALALDAFNASMAAVMRAHLHGRDTLINMISMHTLHLLLCGPLMRWLGLPGFAVAMAISRAFGLTLHLWLWKRRLDLVPRARDWWTLRGRRLAPVLHIGLPGAAENIAWRLAFMTTVSFAAAMGVVQLATHSVTIQIQTFVLLFSLALGFATEIVVGHLVGAGRLHEADRHVRRSLRWGIAVSAGTALAAALGAPWLLPLITRDPKVVEAATTLLWIAVLLEPGRVFNLVVINALRASGDARFPVGAGVVSMAIVMAGGGWLLGVHFGLGLPGLWIAYAADEWVRGLTMMTRWNRRGWLSHARATQRRVVARRRRAVTDPGPTTLG
jgi:putative MATE family efflux protein